VKPRSQVHAGEDPALDRLRAATRLVENREAVVRFAARGCGRPGRRPVMAPLSDPTATPGEDSLPAVDAGDALTPCRTLEQLSLNESHVHAGRSQDNSQDMLVLVLICMH
jgi:hypothetical protein